MNLFKKEEERFYWRIHDVQSKKEMEEFIPGKDDSIMSRVETRISIA